MELVLNRPDPFSADKDDKTAIHFAIQRGNLEIIKFLLEYKAAINVRGEVDHLPSETSSK